MEEVSFQEYATTKQGPRFPKKLLLVLLFLLVLAGLGFTGYGILNSTDSELAATPTDTPIPTEMPTETPTPTIDPSITPGKLTPTKAASGTPTPSKAQSGGAGSVDKATGLDRADLTVEVLNGGGVAGAAGKMADELEDFGYAIGGTDNTETFDYTDVTIQVKSTKSKYLALLKKDLGATHTIDDATSDLAASHDADAVVIIGKE